MRDFPRAGAFFPALAFALSALRLAVFALRSLGFFAALPLPLLCLAASLPAQEAEDSSSGPFPGGGYLDVEGVTVTASPETTQQMKVLSREDIEAAHAPDLAVLLRETLNLGMTRYGPYGNQTDISLRGFDSERIAFLMNGVPVNSPGSGGIELSAIDLNSVDRIEVIHGGSDSKYNVAGALGGVINIITVKRRKPGLWLGGSFSNTAALPGDYDKPGAGGQRAKWQDLADTQNIALSLGLGTEKNSWSAGFFANRAGNHFLFTDYYGRTLRREGNEVWDAGGSLSLVRDLGPCTIIAGGDLYYGDKRIPSSGISAAGERQRIFSGSQNLMLEAPLAFREDLSAEASLTHAWQGLEYGDASRHGIYTLTAINRWSWQGPHGLGLRLGWDYRYSRIDSTDMGLHDRQDGGLYLTAEYQPLEQVLIIPSIKAVFSGGRAAPVTPVPKLGLLWTPTPSLTLKNNYFRGFKLPDFEDLYWNGGGMRGNPDLKPEDGWGLDLGAAWKPTARISLEGTFFSQWTADSIHWYGSGGQWRPENVGKAVFFGLDLGPRIEIPLGSPAGRAGLFEKLLLSLSYKPLLSYLLSYGYDYSSNKRIPYMPSHSAAFSIEIFWKGGIPPGDRNPAGSWNPAGSLALSGHYEGLRYADTANLDKLRPCFLLNANLNQRISRHFSAFAVFRNLLNQSYESFNDYYMPGLTVTLGIRLNFQASPAAGER